MGAQFNRRVYKTSDFDEACRLWADDVKQSRLDHGRLYSGRIGMFGDPPERSKETFTNEDDAEFHIYEHHQKWSPPIAVRFVATVRDGDAMRPEFRWMIGGLCPS